MLTHLDGLNDSQQEAVTTIDGPLLVVAGAGSGKTKTLIHRMKHIVHSGIDPRHILAITFTNKAAREMNERFGLGERERYYSNTPFIGTFHSLGVKILQTEHDAINRPKHFTIFDREDTKRALKEAMRQTGYDPKQLDVNKVLAVLSRKKSASVSVKRFADELGGGNAYNRQFMEAVSEVWGAYERILEKEGALDFDDLLLKTAALLEANSEIRNKYQKIWSHIHIDEYQDTNAVQYTIAKLLAGNTAHICAVGDADQSIYSWRGADISNILNFERDFPQAKIVKLETNYRSTKNILGAAGSVIKNNKERIDKKLDTPNPEGDKLYLYGAYTESEEAKFVASESQKLIDEGVRPSEIAVLYRTNFQSRALEEAFLSAHIPYQLLGTKFFDRKEVKDVLSYIRAALNPDSNTDIARTINTPARGIGKVTLLKVLEGNEGDLAGKAQDAVKNFREILSDIKTQSETLPVSELVMFVFERSGIRDSFEELHDDEREERVMNVAELATLAQRYDHLPPLEAVSSFLMDVALQGDQDSLDETKDGVRLMTVHASKGLEFDVVFIVGLEEGLFPYKRPDDTGKDLEEERRLFYVAITRARKKVYLTYAMMRRVFGSTDMKDISSFINEIDQNLIEYSAVAAEPDSIDNKRKKGIESIFDIEF